MELDKGIEILDLGLIVDNNLVFADIHLGYEESQNKQGILMPRVHFKALLERFKKNLEGKKFDSIILNGDIKHEFGSISTSEWRNVVRFFDFLAKYTDKIQLIEGNHDPMLHYIAKKRNMDIVNFVVIGDKQINEKYIFHGDKIPTDEQFKKSKIIIIGHDHPAIGLHKQARVEVYKCFLSGKWKGKKMIVMPSCNLASEGSDILATKPLSPLLKSGYDDFEVYIVSDDVYNFGKVAKLRDL